MIKKKLTIEQKKSLELQIAEIEKSTIGEVVLHIVPKSDDYPGARWRLAIFTSLFSGALLTWFFDHWEPALYIWCELFALGLGYLLGRSFWILRPFLSQLKMAEEVHQRAQQSFFTNGVHLTQGNSGILVLVSLLERRIEVLADRGISQKLPPETWKSIVESALDLIKKDSLFSGLQYANRECGKLLIEKFPGTHDNVNELPNHVIVED